MRFLLLALFCAPSAFAQDAAGVADSFYAAFARHDSATMTSLYADVEGPQFSDPIFPELTTRETRGMWRMLVAAGADLKLEYRIEAASDDQVTVHWRADYSYAGNPVVNEVTSTLQIRDGKITSQKDEYDLCRWTTQALGAIKGRLACYFPSSLRKQAKANLENFLATHPENP